MILMSEYSKKNSDSEKENSTYFNQFLYKLIE